MLRFAFSPRAWLAVAAGCAPALALAASATPKDSGWQACSAVADAHQRLACFDTWAARQTLSAPTPAPVPTTTASDWNRLPTAPASTATAQPTAALAQATADTAPPYTGGCRDPEYTPLARFFELESATDCGRFNLRGYQPLTLSVIHSDSVNRQPSSPTRGSASTQPYQRQEMRIQLSVRTKLAHNLLTRPGQAQHDSLWFGYTQQSYWQLFNGAISRPFRNTDYAPEVFYVYPTDTPLPGGWRWRYSGLGLVHQSNGQSNPLSRSWNRWYLMAGAEQGNRWLVQLKAYQRIAERGDKDDNPGIQDSVGRGEAQVFWNVNAQHTLGLTARGSLGRGRGSGRLEWLRTLGDQGGEKSNLRLHVQLFSGYGDSLVDYNRKRTVFSVGLSLLDF